MKIYVLAFCIALFGVASALTRCKSAEECDAGECCVTFVSFLPGHCSALKQEGESCSHFGKKGEKLDKYHFQCPCEEGLECVATHEMKVLDHIIKMDPKCVVPGDDQVSTVLPDPETEPQPDPETEPEPQPETEPEPQPES